MHQAVGNMAERASDPALSDRLARARDGIARHTVLIRDLLMEVGGETSKEHCKDMEGLVAEARKHALDADDLANPVRDVANIAQYQRICHYGIAGFGTA